MYKKYNCPYQRPCYPTCTFKYGPTHCSYKDCEDCPYFKESKAWSSMDSFFKRKSKIKPINPPNSTISARGSA